MACRRFPGKVAVVTASTDGIGLAIARRLAQEGAAVVVSSRKQKNVDRVVSELKGEGHRVVGVVCHVGKSEDRQRLFETAEKEFGGVDILVSNAAANPSSAPPLEMTESAYDKTWDINVKASFYLIKEVVPYIEKRGGGSVIVVSSIGGYQPGPGTEVYGATKTALFGLIRALTPQLASMNIRINGIAPGLIKTSFSRYLWENDMILQQALLHFPMGRLGTPEECAGPVAFLASDDASYITGETIVMAGGRFSRL